MSDFKSVWCKQTELSIIIPHEHSVRDGYPVYFVMGFRIIVTPGTA